MEIFSALLAFCSGNSPVTRAGASTTRVRVLPKTIDMNILKTLYSSTTRVLISQYSYSYVQYSPQPCRSPVNYPHKGQWRGALMFSLICAWINAWVNNREAGDLRRHYAHYDVTVMYMLNYLQGWAPLVSLKLLHITNRCKRDTTLPCVHFSPTKYSTLPISRDHPPPPPITHERQP